MRMRRRLRSRSWEYILLVAFIALRETQASIELNLDNRESIKNAAKTAAAGMVKYYTGYRPGDVPGNLPDPYYWWEAGAMFGALIDYNYYTGDTQYVNITTQAMLWQVGPKENYMPPNQSSTLGNDDQGFWGMSAMAAAENNFPNPPEDQPQWLALAQAVFHSQAARWDNKTCGGGLKWQIFTFNNGYNYKNTISNGVYFNLAARLARYTGNETYAKYAEQAWDWTFAIGIASPTYEFFDGTDDRINCTGINHVRWTYNAGVYMHGAANMYSYSNGSDVWERRLRGILQGVEFFFSNDVPNVMSEVTCESSTCNVDQRSFKAYLSRWMAGTAALAPFTADFIMPKLRASAQAAALQCNGPDNACGLRWVDGAKYDGSTGVGEQMSAMEIFQANLLTVGRGPFTNSSGGTSVGGNGDYNAVDEDILEPKMPVTNADRAGAGIVTVTVIAAILGSVWLIVT